MRTNALRIVYQDNRNAVDVSTLNTFIQTCRKKKEDRFKQHRVLQQHNEWLLELDPNTDSTHAQAIHAYLKLLNTKEYLDMDPMHPHSPRLYNWVEKNGRVHDYPLVLFHWWMLDYIACNGTRAGELVGEFHRKSKSLFKIMKSLQRESHVQTDTVIDKLKQPDLYHNPAFRDWLRWSATQDLHASTRFTPEHYDERLRVYGTLFEAHHDSDTMFTIIGDPKLNHRVQHAIQLYVINVNDRNDWRRLAKQWYKQHAGQQENPPMGGLWLGFLDADDPAFEPTRERYADYLASYLMPNFPQHNIDMFKAAQKGGPKCLQHFMQHSETKRIFQEFYKRPEHLRYADTAKDLCNHGLLVGDDVIQARWAHLNNHIVVIDLQEIWCATHNDKEDTHVTSSLTRWMEEHIQFLETLSQWKKYMSPEKHDNMINQLKTRMGMLLLLGAHHADKKSAYGNVFQPVFYSLDGEVPLAVSMLCILEPEYMNDQKTNLAGLMGQQTAFNPNNVYRQWLHELVGAGVDVYYSIIDPSSKEGYHALVEQVERHRARPLNLKATPLPSLE